MASVTTSKVSLESAVTCESLTAGSVPVSLRTVPINVAQQTFSVAAMPLDSSLLDNNELSSSPIQLLLDAAALSDDGASPPVASKHKTKASMLKFPPCDICEGKASGLHYGCNTCEACKNFYRRYLLRKQGYTCLKSNDCLISYTNRGNCSACRLEKCLKLGMSKEKSKMGRYSYSRRTETIKKVRKLEGKDKIIDKSVECESIEMSSVDSSNESYACGQLNQSPGTSFNSNTLRYDSSVIEVLVTALDNMGLWAEDCATKEMRQEKIQKHHEKYSMKVKMFGQLNAVSMEEYHNLLKNYGIDIDGQWEIMKKSAVDWEDAVGRYCKFAKNIPDFQLLSYTDQSNLLKSTHFDFFTILMNDAYDDELKIFVDVDGQPYHIEEAGDKFFTREFLIGVAAISVHMQELSLTKSETVLLISIATMCTDVCKLQNSALVEKVQFRLTNLLIEDMQKRLGGISGMKRFTKFIDCLVRLRKLSAVYYKEYKAICSDKMLTDSIPNLGIVLPEDD